MKHTQIVISIMAAFISMSTVAAEPVPAVNGRCPIYYNKHKGYCEPRPHAADAIVRQGSGCPLGWRKSGGHCTRGGSSLSRHAIERTGSSCPRGYSKDRGYCVKR